MGNTHPNIVPYETFACASGRLIIAVGNARQFAQLVASSSMKVPAELGDQRGCVADCDAASRAITALIRAWALDELLARLAEQGIPAGPINTVAEALGDPQILARGMQLELERADGTRVPGLRTLIRFSDADRALSRASPMLGEGS